MDEKINLKAVEKYCEEYTSRVVASFFAGKGKITGPDILQLCDIRQINLFIIYELFKTWRAENNKIKSPYFDYADKTVQEAIENLMARLSNNISIDREHFTPLLKKAVENTLMLIVDPYDFFADLIEGEQGYLEIESFREQLKYLKINRPPLERLLQKIEEKNIGSLSGNEAFAMLDSILEEVNFTPEDVDDYLAKLSTICPISLDQLYDQKTTPAPPPSEKKAVQGIQPRQPAINTAYSQPKHTVNEQLAQQPKPTLADNFKKIARIKDSLTINQKFMFTKVLFHGDFELFSKAIDDLDRQDNLNGALKYLEKNYEEWDRESEEFHEFMELLEKRFV